MNKKFLIVVICIISLFSFNSSVYADAKEYYFTVSTSSDRQFMKWLCGANKASDLNTASNNTCFFHFKSKPTKKGNDNFNIKKGKYVDNDNWTTSVGTWDDINKDDFKNVDMFSLSDYSTPQDIMRALQSKEYAVCGKKSKGSCYDYVSVEYCKISDNDYSNKSSTACTALFQEKGKSTTDEFGHHECSTPLRTIGEGSWKSDELSIYMNYAEKGEFIIKVDSRSFLDGNYVTKGDNTFYLYPKGDVKSYDQIVEMVKNKYIELKYQCSDAMGGFCLDIDSKDTKKKNWYYEMDVSKCNDETKYVKDVSQKVGGGTDFYQHIDEIDVVNSANIKFKDNKDFQICKDNEFMGDAKLSEYLHTLVNVVKILIPIILLGLGTFDFVQAILAQDEGNIKKAQATFVKRLIIAVIIFLIPIILKFILGIAHTIWPIIDADMCGLL